MRRMLSRWRPVAVLGLLAALLAGGAAMLDGSSGGGPVEAGTTDLSGVSCADVYLGELETPVHAPVFHTAGDPPLASEVLAFQVATSLNHTQHNTTDDSTESAGATYNLGIAGVIGGLLPSIPKCVSVDKVVATVTTVTTEPPATTSDTTFSIDIDDNASNPPLVGMIVYWNSTTASRAGFYYVTAASSTSVTLQRTRGTCNTLPAATDPEGDLRSCVVNNKGIDPYAFSPTNVVKSDLYPTTGEEPRPGAGTFDGVDTLTNDASDQCSVSTGEQEGANQNAWTRTELTTVASLDASYKTPSFGTAILYNPTVPKTCADITTTLSAGINDSVTTIPLTDLTNFPDAGRVTLGTGTGIEKIDYTGRSATSGAGNLTGATRGVDGTTAASWLSGDDISATNRSTTITVVWPLDSVLLGEAQVDWDSDYDKDGCLDHEELDWPVTDLMANDGGRDPYNPYDCDRDYNGIFGIEIEAIPVTLVSNVVTPGAFYRCRADITHNTVPNPDALTVRVFCYGDQPNLVVNAAAAGATTCPTAPPSACGDGLSGGSYPVGTAPPPKDWPTHPNRAGAPETGTQCNNNTDNDGDGKVNDGCPAVGPSETGGKCVNDDDDDGDTKVNDGCPSDGAAESGADCANTVDDDPGEDMTFLPQVNDGCPHESATMTNCNDLDDDDGDGLVNDGCVSKLYAEVPTAHIVLTGTYDPATDIISLTGCAPAEGIQGPNVYFSSTDVDGSTGHGHVDIWLAQATCAVPGGDPDFDDANVQLTEEAPRQTTITTAGYDYDLDRCPDQSELLDAPNNGGLRDPFNRYDYFEPTGNQQNRAGDISMVVNDFFVDYPDPAYNPATDRTGLPGSNAWNLGPPDGLHRAADISASVKQFFQDCP